jgi:FixJ family two-component response regulator
MDYLVSEDSSPICMILDQHMLQMTGLELAARLRDKADGVPIMLVTSSLTPAMAERAIELGIRKVSEKPASEEELLSFVSTNTWIARGRN